MKFAQESAAYKQSATGAPTGGAGRIASGTRWSVAGFLRSEADAAFQPCAVLVRQQEGSADGMIPRSRKRADRGTAGARTQHCAGSRHCPRELRTLLWGVLAPVLL